MAFLAVLGLLERIAPPYDPQTGKLVSSLPFAHISRMLSYAAGQTSPHGPKGIASYPWEWLIDVKPIVYLQINPGHPTAALNRIQPAVHFLGLISPPMLLLLTRRWRSPRSARPGAAQASGRLGIVGLPGSRDVAPFVL